MKKFLQVLMISLFAVGIMNPASFAMGKRHKAYPDVKTISKEELQKKMEAGEPVQIINVLNPDYYKLGIIKGSKKIPLSELESRLGELDKSQEVVTYCASYQCGASSEAAHVLAQKGFNVRAYEGGIKEWKEAGLPVD